MLVDIQFSPAAATWPDLKRAVVAAEAQGFDAVHVFDHLLGIALDGHTMLECCTLLGALTQITERIELGTMVANVGNRQLGTLLIASATVAQISGRRFYLGIGAGSSPTSPWAREHQLLSIDLEPDLRQRHQRVEDLLVLADRLWGDTADPALATAPLPDIRPVTIVGVNSVALSRLAGRRADGINVKWNDPRRDEFLAAADLAATGREFVRTAFTTYSPDLLDERHPTRVEMSERGIDRLVLAVFDDLSDWC